MIGPTPHEVLQHRANIGLIAAFFVFLCLPTADSFLRMDRTPTINENRAAARFPSFHPSLHGAREFLSGLESYFNDHFGYRKRLVSWEKRWKKQIFRISTLNSAMVGKDGWLFFAGSLVLDDIMGNRPFTEAELEDWRQFLTQRRDWLAERGIRYLFMIPPDKHTIYPEYLPDWLAATARPPHRLDQFISYMRTHSDVSILDLRRDLMEAKRTARVYLKTDTHWSNMGVFIACRRIIETLASLGIRGEPLELSAFHLSTMPGPVGDLARMLGQETGLTEDQFFEAKPPLSPFQTRPEPKLINKQWKPGTDPLVTENRDKMGKALLFHDSFGAKLPQFLGYHFNRVACIWQQNWDKTFIEREKPDIVIDEMLERFVIRRNPADLRAADERPDVQLLDDR